MVELEQKESDSEVNDIPLFPEVIFIISIGGKMIIIMTAIN